MFLIDKVKDADGNTVSRTRPICVLCHRPFTCPEKEMAVYEAEPQRLPACLPCLGVPNDLRKRGPRRFWQKPAS